MILHCLANRREDDTLLGEFLLEGGLHRHRVHHCVDSRTAQGQALLKGNAQLVERFFQLGVYLPVLWLLGQRVGIVGDGLEVDLRHMHMSPFRHRQREPVAISLQAEVEQPLGLALLLRDQPHHVLVESLGDDICVNVGGEAVLVLLLRHLLHISVFFFLVNL